MLHFPKITVLIGLAIFIGGLLEATRAASFRERRSAQNDGQNSTSDDVTNDWEKQVIRLSKSADISAMLNVDVKPCDDFYQYSCGSWHRSNPAQLLSNIMTDKFQQIAKTFDYRFETLLEEAKVRDGLERKVYNFYTACQVVRKDDLLYSLELENAYKEFGELPVLAGDAWQEDDFSWWQIVAKIQHKYGVTIMLGVDIMGDIKNNSQNQVYLGPPEFSITDNTKLMSVLHETAIYKNLKKFFDVEDSLAKKTAKELVEFEQALVHGSTDARLGLTLQELLEIREVDHLKKTYNESMDMRKYLELVLGEGEVPELVYVYDEKYLKNLFATVAAKPKRVVANYIMWHLLQPYFVDADDADLPKYCIGKTKKYFGKYIDHLVYSRYRTDKMEQDVYQLWEDIRGIFRDELKGDKLDWIKNATREYAIEKLDTMELKINSYESENFTEEYGDLDIDALKHVFNIRQLQMQESRRYLANLHKPGATIEATEIMSFTPVYNILENNIRIPVALMQPHFFWDTNYPHALKYATLGYLIAHEMIHGFDDEGRKYDKHGNVHDWWDERSTYEFDSRRKCFQAQYHNYVYDGHNLPESVSQSENIADNAAVKLAHKAYKRWLVEQRKTVPDIDVKEQLDHLPLDNQQLFFVSFAQVWCEDVQSLFRKTITSADTHAPGMYRVIGSLSNYQDFSWVFQCKTDAPMDPEFKCAIY